jgi:hypothetical protein
MLVVVVLTSALATAQDGVNTHDVGTCSAQDGGCDSPAARDAALKAIPWRQLSPKSRGAVQRVVNDTTIYRQMPTRVIDCDETMFAFLVDHPALVVDSWNVMGVSRLKLDAVRAGHYRVADNAGAVGDVRVLHRDGGVGKPLRMLMIADGTYQAPPMPSALRGQSVLLLRAEAVTEPTGRTYVTTRLDTFLRFDGAATKIVAKTLKPLIVRTAEHNFVETMRFASLFSRTAETNPRGMERLAEHLQQTDETTRKEFVTVSYETSARYEKWRRARERLAMGEGAERR